ncbi:hypothetical protein ABZV91_08040 [Nocardia sp. NPDC004568]|uniref:hypothetical protein n=1 Tax=Nocardia sp. NPDC004568 TaxID=3154551 RepID=UPI0033B0D6FA
MTATAAASATTGESSPTQHAVDVQWPDPSPLQSWWTEVMDGVPISRYRRAA